MESLTHWSMMRSEDKWAIVLVAICVVIVLLPPQYDPNLRWKQWREFRQGRMPPPEPLFGPFDWVNAITWWLVLAWAVGVVLLATYILYLTVG